MDSKIIKMRCPKHGKLFCAELKSIKGAWKVVNFIPVSNDEYNALQSEINEKQLLTNESLLACRHCGNRILGGCSCSYSFIKCCNSDKYDFNCIYCNKIEIDYSAATKNIPYNQWAGVSNIPDAIKDKYGNPFGSQYDLAKDNAFSGYKIIVLNLCSECIFSEPQKALNKKGFEVIEYKSLPNLKVLKEKLNDRKTQLWVVSDRVDRLNQDYILLIKQCFDSGMGIYIWGDNDPYYVDANKIIKHLFNTYMTGNRPGKNVLGIQKNSKGPGIIANHLITTGITNFFEGITIAEIKCNNDLIPLIYGMEGQVITAYYDRLQKRALVDGAFTRLYCNWDSAGTDRYIVNAAAWLANIERFGYQQ